VQEIAAIYRRACNNNAGPSANRCFGGSTTNAIHWQTNDGVATQRSLNNAAIGQFGLGTAKLQNWTARATEAGVSDNLSP
jgi:hypothetical protein